MHLGILLPNYDREASPETILGVATTAEQLGYDSVWVTEHVLAPPEIYVPYGRVFDPLVTLAWLASQTTRVGLGTSIIVVPVRNPIRLANETASLQNFSGGRVLLGVAAGWVEPEFRALGFSFEDRGRRLDEALRLMQALWSGADSFSGEYWTFDEMRFGPLPEPRPPQLWMGGTGQPTIRRARELGAVWHPNWLSPDQIRATLERAPGLEVVPRIEIDFTDFLPRSDFNARSRPLRGETAAVTASLQAYLDAGCNGFVIGLGIYDIGSTVKRLEHFAEKVRPALVKD